MKLVTGGTGLLGSHVLLDLTRSGKKVRAIRRKSSKSDALISFFESAGQKKLFDNIEWVDGDVLDLFSLSDALKGAEQVYHCAGLVSFSPKDDEKMLAVNYRGTENVVNLALETGVKKFCHVSSIAALGRTSSSEIITEESGWKNSGENSPYAISKYSAEREVWRGIAEGMDAVIVNPSVILGPGDWHNSSARIFSQIQKGMKFYSDGVNGFVDVRDVSKAMIQLMDSPVCNERFIVSSENYSYERLFSEISACLGKPKPFIKVNPFISAIAWRVEFLRSLLTGSNPLITKATARTALGKYYYSNKKLSDALKFSFIPVKKSIEDTSAAFLRQRNPGRIND